MVWGVLLICLNEHVYLIVHSDARAQVWATLLHPFHHHHHLVWCEVVVCHQGMWWMPMKRHSWFYHPQIFMGPRGAPTTCNEHGASRSYSFGQIWADLRADLCPNSYEISLLFSLLSSPPLCTQSCSFQKFPYVTTFSLRSISVFYLWKTEWFQKELSPSETVIFGPRDFGKRSFSEILVQCNFGKNRVWKKVFE